MLKKIILVGAAALAISAATAPAAFAAAPWNGGGYNNSNWGNDGGNYGGNYHPQPKPQQCTPVTQTFHWWDRWGHMHAYTKVVGQTCVPVPPPPPPHHPPFFPHGWGWSGW